MPLTLPKLDDRTYADLLDEARALIPSLYPDWTDHNPSDPGVTLVELFAWLSEMLIFRADQVPDRHRLVFLRLLNGPERDQSLLAGAPGLDEPTRERLLDLLYAPDQGVAAPAALVDEAVRVSMLGLRSRERAITSDDYEALARAASPLVSRARCLPRRNLDDNTEAGRSESRAGHVSVILVPKAADPPVTPEPPPIPSQELLEAVWQALDERRTLTTRHHVVAPFYAPVNAEILVARRADARDQHVRDAVVAACASFLHPLSGGPDGNGWPFGRPIYLSELYALLESVLGVDYVPDITLSSACEPGAPRCVLAVPIWHESGDPIGLSIEAHHLPRAAIDPARVVVTSNFAQLRLTVAVVLEEEAEQARVYRLIKAALKQRLHPLHGGPDGGSQWVILLDGTVKDSLDKPWNSAPEITVAALRAIARAVPGVQSVASLSITSDARWQIRNSIGEIVAFGSQPGARADAPAELQENQASGPRVSQLIDPQVIVTRA